MSAQMEFWLYLYFPQLQLDKLLVLHSSTPATKTLSDKGKSHHLDLTAPLAIVGADHQLLQLNSAARQAGLTLGMGLASAASLCHQLQLVSHQAEQEQQQLQQLAQLLY